MILEFKDICSNPISINIKYIVAIYCDSEIILSTGDRIKIDMPFDQLKEIINSALRIIKH